MPNFGTLYDNIRERLVDDPDWQAIGVNERNFYRQYLPTVENPGYPCFTVFAAMGGDEIRQAEIVSVTMMIVCHDKKMLTPQKWISYISDTLKQDALRGSYGGTFVYSVFVKNSSPFPEWNNDIGVFEAFAELEIKFG